MGKPKIVADLHLFIDGREVELDLKAGISLSGEVISLHNLKADTGAAGQTLSIPVTPRNRSIMGAAELAISRSKFNARKHTARLESGGATLRQGQVLLLSCDTGNSTEAGYYRIRIAGGAEEWLATAAATPVAGLLADFSELLTGTTIKESWTWDKPVRFLPVLRDGSEAASATGSIFPPIRLLTVEDYHPFLHIRAMIHSLFAKAGYKLRSEFFAGEFFGTLHMSGNYLSRSGEADRNAMDFRAGRFNRADAVADSRGRVHADPYRGFNSIGNIVDTANPNQRRGEQDAGNVYDNGACFGMDDLRIVFTPLREVTVAFRYSLHYTTDYLILDRNTLRGFDTIYLSEGTRHVFVLPNRFTDRRAAITVNFIYTVVVFGHIAGDSYQFRYYERSGSSYVQRIHATTFSARSFKCTIQAAGAVKDPEIWVKRQGAGSYVKYVQDWAMYDGYVGERGQTEVALEVVGAAEKLSPSHPKFFDLTTFEGAEPGMALSLHKKTCVTPIFAEYPTSGTRLKAEQVAAVDATGLDLLRAVTHLFDLRFITNSSTRTVYVEPGVSFHNRKIVDWSDKTDTAKAVTITEPGKEFGQRSVFAYRTGDGAVSRRNREGVGIVGRWEASVPNLLAPAIRNLTSPLFTASLDLKGGYDGAPDASLVQAGDRDSEASWKNRSLNFPCKIVAFTGMKSLPQGQLWGWPGNDTKYPAAVFSDPAAYPPSAAGATGSGLSLRFEDHGGVRGLRTYWAPVLRRLENAKRIEIFLHLRPHEVMQLINPSDAGADFRALFRLDAGGATSLYRLEKVCEYDPAGGGSTKCVFIREV